MPRTRRRRQRTRELTDDLFLRPPMRPPVPFLVLPSPADSDTPLAPSGDPVSAAAGAESQVVRLTRVAAQAEAAGHPEQAMEVLDAAVANQPEAVDLLVLRAAVLGRQRRLAEAEKDLRRAVRLAPGNGQALLDLGLLLWRKGLAVEAAELFDHAAAHQPRNPVAFNYLAEALNQAGEPENAVVALERSLALDPRQPRAYYLMGRVLDRLRRPDEARLAYRRGQELTGR
ncbi:MAG TPA: tetratricopeptide repeat protein [Gemmatimonadales bacterium]|nr:tetratricopeptide repeat protein [Gemmatimonadales bacterium]